MVYIKWVIKNPKDWCWHCGWFRNEWINLPVFIERRGKCFNCRIDALDIKYGPGQTATAYKNGNQSPDYAAPLPSYWYFRRVMWLQK